jgi:hypothetical protein
MKKLSFALTAVALGIIGASSSGFKPHGAAQLYTFYNTSTNAQSTSKADYQFKDVNPGCVATLNHNCSIQFTQVTVPAVNAHPSTTATLVPGSVVTSAKWNGVN